MLYQLVFLLSLPTTEPKLLQKWLKNMGLDKKQLSARSRLCSDHLIRTILYAMRPANVSKEEVYLLYLETTKEHAFIVEP